MSEQNVEVLFHTRFVLLALLSTSGSAFSRILTNLGSFEYLTTLHLICSKNYEVAFEFFPEGGGKMMYKYKGERQMQT